MLHSVFVIIFVLQTLSENPAIFGFNTSRSATLTFVALRPLVYRNKAKISQGLIQNILFLFVHTESF